MQQLVIFLILFLDKPYWDKETILYLHGHQISGRDSYDHLLCPEHLHVCE